MASLTRRYDRQKLLGQIYTPRPVVEKMIADIRTDTPIAGLQILDPACGDGQFLVALAEKIIADSAPDQVATHLTGLHGWDVDPEAVTACIRRLNALISHLPIQVQWNIRVCNALEQRSLGPCFDLIIGNPPYIRIQHLSPEDRAFIQTHYAFCRYGSTDIYVAFYELCWDLLRPMGRCILITPNTFFYTETGRTLRQHLRQHQALIRITNYADIQVFAEATTYSAIVAFGRQPQEHFWYEQAVDMAQMAGRKVTFDQLDGPAWALSAQPVAAPAAGVPLGQIARIHVGITTLCDQAYIVEIQEDRGEHVLARTRLRGHVLLEKELLRPLIKASKYKDPAQPIHQYILFPYAPVAAKHRIIPEDQLAARYPLAYAYLCSLRPELDRRDNGRPNPVAWYAFGRSQGLDTSFGPKILFSPMNRQPRFVLSERADCTFYSGYCIKYDGDVHALLAQLNSARMATFIAAAGRDFRGGWKAYNKKTLEQFVVEQPEKH